MSNCKFCKKQIYWSDNLTKPKPFDDPELSSIHKCSQFSKSQLSTHDIFEIKEKQEIDHNLIVKLISKINDLERRLQ